MLDFRKMSVDCRVVVVKVKKILGKKRRWISIKTNTGKERKCEKESERNRGNLRERTKKKERKRDIYKNRKKEISIKIVGEKNERNTFVHGERWKEKDLCAKRVGREKFREKVISRKGRNRKRVLIKRAERGS